MRLLICAVLLAVPLAAGAAAKKPKLAILELQVAKGVVAGTEKLLSEVMISEATHQGRFDVIGSSDIAAIIGFERQKQLLGCQENTSCMAEISGALGVDFIVSGQLGRLGSRFRLDLKLVDTNASRVVAREGEFTDANEDALTAALQRLLPRLLAAGAPPAAAEGPSGSSPVLAYGTLGGAGAFLAAGVALGLSAKGLAAEMATQRQELGSSSGAYSTYYQQHIDSLRLQMNLADAAYGVSAVAAGVGLYLLLSPPAGPKAVSLAAGPGFAAVSFSGGF